MRDLQTQKAIKSMYDVESLGDDKDDKIDLLPPIYSRDVQQPQGHIKFLSNFCFNFWKNSSDSGWNVTI